MRTVDIRQDSVPVNCQVNGGLRLPDLFPRHWNCSQSQSFPGPANRFFSSEEFPRDLVCLGSDFLAPILDQSLRRLSHQLVVGLQMKPRLIPLHELPLTGGKAAAETNHPSVPGQMLVDVSSFVVDRLAVVALEADVGLASQGPLSPVGRCIVVMAILGKITK